MLIFINEVYKERNLFHIKYILYGIALSGWGVAGGMIACNIIQINITNCSMEREILFRGFDNIQNE